MSKQPSYGTNSPGATKKHLDFLTAIVYGVTFVIALGFLTFIIQYFTATQSAFQNLSDKVNILIERSDQFKKNEQDKVIEDLQNQINTIKQKNPYLKY